MAELRPVSELASVILAPNPGPMTLDGTNSYVLRAARPAAESEPGPAVVVDPGPDDAPHLAALAAAGPVELILITHQHLDHTEGAEELHRLTGAPVRAPRAEDCHGGQVLVGGERIIAGGVAIDVLATPGHTADSVCFSLPGDGPWGSVLTGDTVLGRGSTVIGIPDGTLRQYFGSLQTLAALGPCRGLPAHGPQLDNLPAVCREYLAHRQDRLDQVRRALAAVGVAAADADIAAITAAVYNDVDPRVRFAAEHSVAAQLAYLAEQP